MPNQEYETYNEFNNVNDDVLIRSEIERLDEILSKEDKYKRELILKAADKLAMKYQDNTTVVCAKLHALICRDKTTRAPDGEIISRTHARVSKGYVNEILPKKYKRKYELQEQSLSASDDDPDDDTPINSAEEALAWLFDIYKDAASVAKSHLADMQQLRRSENPQDQKLYKEMVSDFEDIISHKNLEKTFKLLQKQISEIRDLTQFVEMLKNLKTSVKANKNLLDGRQKFSTAMKMHLQILFVTESYDHIASTLTGKPHGAKWLSQIDRDKSISKLNEIIKCPKCGLNANKWIEKAKENQKRCMDLPDFDSFCE